MIQAQPIQRSRMKSAVRTSLAMIFVLALSRPALAQEFSADVISRTAGGKVSKSKLYQATDKKRFDSTLALAGGKTMETRLIIDLGAKLIYLVEPQQKMILVNHVLQLTGANPGNGPSSTNPCLDLMRAMNPMLASRQIQCTRLGSESVGGRAADKWRMDARLFGNGPSYLWVDSQVKVAIKWTLPDGSSGELENIKVGPQPGSLFVLPADYRRQDLPH